MLKQKMLMMSLGVMLLMMEVGMAADYTVGGSDGGWNQATDLTSWASSITFLQGDNLIFRYSINHDITEVSKPDFDSCNPNNPLQQPHTGGATVIPLTSAGTRYFICGTGGHCLGGMKLEVTTLAASAPPPSTTPVIPSPPPPSTTPAVPSPPPPTPPVASSPPPTATPPVPSPPPSTTPAVPPPPPSTTPAVPSPPPTTTPAVPTPSPKPSPDHPKSRAPSPSPKQYSRVSPSPSAAVSSPTGSPPPAPSSAAKFDVMSGLITGLAVMAFVINV